MPELEDFACMLSKIEPLEEWFSVKDDEESCRPCKLQPLASMYVGELEEVGEQELADSLKATFEEGDILTIAQTMDAIKASVEDNTRKSLEKLDCFTQSLKDT